MCPKRNDLKIDVDVKSAALAQTLFPQTGRAPFLPMTVVKNGVEKFRHEFKAAKFDVRKAGRSVLRANDEAVGSDRKPCKQIMQKPLEQVGWFFWNFF
jgi:hypothetical protein